MKPRGADLALAVRVRHLAHVASPAIGVGRRLQS